MIFYANFKENDMQLTKQIFTCFITSNSPHFCLYKTLFPWIAILAVLTSGCGPSAITPITSSNTVNGLLVEVHEFDSKNADVRDYTESVQPYSLETAQAIVEALQQAGMKAQLASPGTHTNPQIIVEGQITQVEGGSTATRLLVGGFGPAGAAHFGVQGTVKKKDGTLIGRFTADRLAWMDWWWPSASRLLTRTAKVVGYDVAEMITTGKYNQGNSPPNLSAGINPMAEQYKAAFASQNSKTKPIRDYVVKVCQPQDDEGYMQCLRGTNEKYLEIAVFPDLLQEVYDSRIEYENELLRHEITRKEFKDAFTKLIEISNQNAKRHIENDIKVGIYTGNKIYKNFF